MLTASARMANVFADLGLQKGDRVAVQVQKSAAALAVYAACLRAGLVLLPLNTAYTAAELDYFLNDAEPGLVVCHPARAESITPLLPKGASLLTMDAEGGGTLTDRATAAAPDQTPCPVAPMIWPRSYIPRAPRAGPRARC